MDNDFRPFAIEIAKKAGAVIKRNFAFGMEKTLKSDSSPVTATDIAVNNMLLEAVRTNYKDHDILAEEESDMARGSDYIWVCDPVDGTIPFSHGIPTGTFSLALVYKGESILGVVYDPFQDRLFVGEKGRGATVNGQSIQVSKAEEFYGTVADCEFWPSALYDTTRVVARLQMHEGVQIIRLASYVYAAVLVAAGELAFAIFPGKTAHDVAAVKVIVDEAGGRATNIRGRDQAYHQPVDGFIASNSRLHDQVVALCAEHMTPLTTDAWMKFSSSTKTAI